MLLPTPDEAVLTLHMDVIGAVDVAASTVTVAASLHDSNLLGVFQLSGDMGFYACFSGQPQFVLSIGGYQPATGSRPARCRPGCSTYAGSAPRSRSAQASSVDLHLVRRGDLEHLPVRRARAHRRLGRGCSSPPTRRRAGSASTSCSCCRPFTIMARATAGVAISAGDKELMGVDLRTRIEGPQPWYAHGPGVVHVLRHRRPVRVRRSATQPGGEPRETHDVAADVTAAVTPPTGWETVDSGDSWGGGVVVDDELPAGLWARPDQLVEVRQSVAPLNRTITAFGEYVPDPARIDATAVTLGGHPVDVAGVDRRLVRAGAVRPARRHDPALGAVLRADDGGSPLRRRRRGDQHQRGRLHLGQPRARGVDLARRRGRHLDVPVHEPGPSLARAPAVADGRGAEARSPPDDLHRRPPLDGQRAGVGSRRSRLLGVARPTPQATAVIEARAASDPGERRRLRVVPSHAAVEPEAA